MPTDGTRLANRYDRAEHGAGILGWVYEYVNVAPIHRRDGMATGLELGVQLAGDWFHRGTRTGEHLYGPRTVHVISPAERYDLMVAARSGEPGLQVGFILYPELVAELAAGGEELAFGRDVELDASFYEFCRAYAAANDRGAELPDDQVRDELLRFTRARLELLPRDPLSQAKHEIDATYNRPLYLEHLAGAVGLHPRTFARRFARRYGQTPIAYRLRLRLNEAARLSWAAPSLTVREIAEHVGFEDLPYFHRTFVAEFGVTPTAYGRRANRA
jgi:AraC-like DNA-binding protein